MHETGCQEIGHEAAGKREDGQYLRRHKRPPRLPMLDRAIRRSPADFLQRPLRPAGDKLGKRRLRTHQIPGRTGRFVRIAG
jgi:hypothetical protein